MSLLRFGVGSLSSDWGYQQEFAGELCRLFTEWTQWRNRKKKGTAGLHADFFMQIRMPHILLKCGVKSVSEQGVKGLTLFSSVSRYWVSKSRQELPCMPGIYIRTLARKALTALFLSLWNHLFLFLNLHTLNSDVEILTPRITDDWTWR